jgi:hypothetical protein
MQIPQGFFAIPTTLNGNSLKQFLILKKWANSDAKTSANLMELQH